MVPGVLTILGKYSLETTREMVPWGTPRQGWPSLYGLLNNFAKSYNFVMEFAEIEPMRVALFTFLSTYSVNNLYCAHVIERLKASVRQVK